MKNFAFRRASKCPTWDMVKDSLHEDFIVEFADTTLFEKGFHKVSDGFEILPEDQFQEEFAKNDLLASEFSERKRKFEETQKSLDQVKMTEHQNKLQKEYEEYKQFLDWKKTKDSLTAKNTQESINNIYKSYQGDSPENQ